MASRSRAQAQAQRRAARAKHRRAQHRGRRLPRPHLRDRLAALGRRRLDVRARRARRRRARSATSSPSPSRRCARSTCWPTPASRCCRPPTHDQHRRPAGALRVGLRHDARDRGAADASSSGASRRRPPSIDTTDTDVPGLIATGGTRFEEVLEGVAIEEPAYLATPTPFPPPSTTSISTCPADVSLGCNADKAHRGGITGARRHRGDGRHRAGSPHPFFMTAATASTRSCSARAPRTRPSTRTATAPASRRTSSRPRPTARCSRSRRRPPPARS